MCRDRRCGARTCSQTHAHHHATPPSRRNIRPSYLAWMRNARPSTRAVRFSALLHPLHAPPRTRRSHLGRAHRHAPSKALHLPLLQPPRPRPTPSAPLYRGRVRPRWRQSLGCCLRHPVHRDDKKWGKSKSASSLTRSLLNAPVPAFHLACSISIRITPSCDCPFQIKSGFE